MKTEKEIRSSMKETKKDIDRDDSLTMINAYDTGWYTALQWVLEK